MYVYSILSVIWCYISTITCLIHDPEVRLYEDWRHESNDEMIEALKRFSHIVSPKVETVMRTIDRRRFMERPAMNNPYWDIPQSLGYGSVLSSPKVHAQALEILKDYLKPGAKVLDIGSGSGYLTACMAHLVGPTGKVTSIEHIDELVNLANKTLNSFYPDLLNRVELISGDGREGHTKGAPYDVIYVGGAVHHYPYTLIRQLGAGGSLLSAVGSYGHQYLTLYTKNLKDFKVSTKEFSSTKFMHLLPKEKQEKLWSPIVNNKNYPKNDPMYLLLQKKIEDEEIAQQKDVNNIHIPLFKEWAMVEPAKRYNYKV